MSRLFLLVLLMGVIDCRKRSYSSPGRNHQARYGGDIWGMRLKYSPVFDEEDSNEEFNEVFINIVDLFKEADAEINKYGLQSNNAFDLYTPDEYRRIYSFENCYQYSLEVKVRRRVLKVTAPCQAPGGNLKDIVILPDNLQTQLLTYDVDRIKSKLVITIPFVKNDMPLDIDEFYPGVSVIQFLR